MWIYAQHGGIVCINGVCEIRPQLNGANSELHVTGGTRPISLAVGSEDVIRARYQQIKDAIEAKPEDRPTHLDFTPKPVPYRFVETAGRSNCTSL